MARTADTTHVGWKTDPVRDDRENGSDTSVASMDGLAAREPKAKDGLFFKLSETQTAASSTIVPLLSTARRSSDLRLKAASETAATDRRSKWRTALKRPDARGKAVDSFFYVIHAENRLTALIEFPLRSIMPTRPGARVRRRRADSSAS
jgi:hypothetical protein